MHDVEIFDHQNELMTLLSFRSPEKGDSFERIIQLLGNSELKFDLSQVGNDKLRKMVLESIERDSIEAFTVIVARKLLLNALRADSTFSIGCKASGHKNIEFIRLILEETDNFKFFTEPSFCLECCLANAGVFGQIETMKLLIDKQANVNGHSLSGSTILNAVINSSFITNSQKCAVISFLHENGLNFYTKGRNVFFHETPLELLVKNENIEGVQLLIALGYNDDSISLITDIAYSKLKQAEENHNEIQKDIYQKIIEILCDSTQTPSIKF